MEVTLTATHGALVGIDEDGHTWVSVSTQDAVELSRSRRRTLRP